MTNVPLETLRDSFEGIMPSVIATTDPAGMPNISYLSHVQYVDSSHVVLSNQFFSKTAANVKASGRATLVVIDGRTGLQHVLDLTFERSMREGEIFERISAHLDVMAGLQGKSDMLKLKAVDIYKVESCRCVEPVAPLQTAPQAPAVSRNLLGEAAATTRLFSEMTDAETLLDRSLELLEQKFGVLHSMILLTNETGSKLSTVASRGYPHFGFGAEVAFGDGIVGIAAQRRLTIRIADMRRGQRYVSAVAEAGRPPQEEIAMPVIDQPQSQIALPLIANGRLAGVLFAESTESFAFSHDDEAAFEILAAQIAAGLAIFELADASSDYSDQHPALDGSIHQGKGFRLRFFPHDGGVFIDNDYVIRGVPGRLLFHFVQAYLQTGRTEFSNREIRRDRSLNLPEFKDNLETRLILLRRRLEERGGPVRLERPERGQIRLRIEGMPRLVIE
ncbi:MAG: Signal transduction protein containing and PtsI domain [Proteobacteria bacterium]|nr:Signal transduction protein containing and PtsI domain [Pseudomonadota bacterium]